MLVALAVLIFLPAWTLNYTQAWLFLAVFFTASLAVTLYLMKHDPALLERRLQAGPAAEQEPRQKRIQALAALAFIAIFPVSALDHRFGWAPVPAWLPILGDVLVGLGIYTVFRVFRENSFTSAVIEIGAGQAVISTGPYAVVRHPMYAGAFVMLLGIPPALGSFWGEAAVALIMTTIVWRLLDEEQFLATRLAGYGDYLKQVRFRLIPLVW